MTPLTDLKSRGSGACSSMTLQMAIAQAHEINRGLADISMVSAPAAGSHGSYIYAFSTPAGGFALVFRRGGGDCPAGCTVNEYWYYESNAACQMEAAGHYNPTWKDGCLEGEGSPRWGVPPEPDPARLCGADNTPKDIGGTYKFTASGLQQDCGDKSMQRMVTLPITITVIQESATPEKGTAIISGTGNPRLDGVPWQATFLRRRLAVMQEMSNLPNVCLDQSMLDLNLDFETKDPGSLNFFESHSITCPEPTDGIGYCKGSINLSLTRIL